MSSENIHEFDDRGRGLTIKVVLRKTQGHKQKLKSAVYAYSRYKQAMLFKVKGSKEGTLLRCEMKLKLLRQLR